jgi:hypothetical protein
VVGGGPADGSRVAPGPAAPRQGRPVAPRQPRPAAPRSARPGPLVARPTVPVPPRQRASDRHRPGRFRRFVLRYGWRAYAVPLLSIATIAVLLDLALSPAAQLPDASAAGAAPVSTTPVPTVESAPTRPAEGDADASLAPQVVGEEAYVETGEGTLSVVDGSSEVMGTGPLRRFIVEVEDGIDIDGPGFAEAVQTTLGDPRSWGNGGTMSFQRVGAAQATAGSFDFKVTLVSPGHMEAYCPGVGTGGYTSCRYGDRAVINLARWATAVPDYKGDIATYRRYVINHEVGHVLGHGHEQCPGPGQVAPVMQQQTLGLQGCVKNAWPFP